MALDKVIPELWSARLLRGFDQQNVYGGLVTDVSSEITDGDTIHYGKLTSTVTVGDYTRYSDIPAAQEPADDEEILEMDQQKVFNINVDDLDRVQSRPAMLDEFARKAGVAVSNLVNSYMRGIITADISDANTVETAAAVTAAASRKEFIDKVFDVKEAMDKVFIPKDGRWMVIGVGLESQLLRHLVDEGIGSGAIDDATFRSGELSNFLGLNVVVDPTLADAESAGDAQAYFGINQMTYFARQVAKVEPYRPEKRFADAIKGLYLYGAKKVDTVPAYRITRKA